MKQKLETAFLEAVHNREPVAGLTHNFYRYPARFSPLFAKAAIEAFSDPGDVVLDPFMGSGTTLVEARTLGRPVIGTDINSLGVFVAKVKTTIFSESEIVDFQAWVDRVVPRINLHKSIKAPVLKSQDDYLRNLNDCSTWPLRKFISLVMDKIAALPLRQQNLARCALLRTAQWALDCRTEIPNSKLFREQLLNYSEEVANGSREFTRQTKAADRRHQLTGGKRILCLQRSAIGLEDDPRVTTWPSPKLVLTSPPYPGVHVLYHRWQIQGRRETAAPFWITKTLDGSGASFYTFGDRKQKDLANYYVQALAAFKSLANLADKQTLIVQMVAFSNPTWQLQRYLEVMEQAGLQEIKKPYLTNSSDGRLWRDIPNRRWYAYQDQARSTSQEVVLFHKKS